MKLLFVNLVIFCAMSLFSPSFAAAKMDKPRNVTKAGVPRAVRSDKGGHHHMKPKAPTIHQAITALQPEG